MLRFITRRLAYMAALLFLTSVFVFGLTRARGDPRELYLPVEAYTTQEVWDAWGKEMGLDKPLVIQYAIWASKAVRGDFGASQVTKTDAWQMVRSRIPNTLQLSGLAYVMALSIGLPLGVLSAVKRGTPWDLAGRMFALFGQALPSFWVGLIFILVFAVILRWLPTSQQGGIQHLILPALTLAWGASASTLRLVRSSMLEILDSEYIKLAKAKGVSQRSVIWKHALKNSLIPPLTHFALLLAAFMTGTVVVEQIFAWPGIGRMAVDAVFTNDFPVVSAVVLFFTVIYVGTNLAVDILYAFIDPRIRFS